MLLVCLAMTASSINTFDEDARASAGACVQARLEVDLKVYKVPGGSEPTDGNAALRHEAADIPFLGDALMDKRKSQEWKCHQKLM